MKSPAQIASAFGCTPAQARAQLARNAKGLATMAAKAERTGKPVNHFDARTLRRLSATYRQAYKT